MTDYNFSKKHKPVIHKLKNIFTKRISSSQLLEKATQIKEKKEFYYFGEKIPILVSSSEEDLPTPIPQPLDRKENISAINKETTFSDALNDFAAELLQKNSLPKDLNPKIINSLPLSAAIGKFTPSAVRNYARTLVELSLINKNSHKAFAKELKKLHTITRLLRKYPFYNDVYLEKDNLKKEPPILIDALFSGYPYFRSSTNSSYTEQIEKDIKSIIRLVPESIYCSLGAIRCRTGVTPLAAACYNTSVPISIIKLLFENGADPNTTVNLSNRICPVLEDLEKFVGEIGGTQRFDEIKKLFIQYGYKEK